MVGFKLLKAQQRFGDPPRGWARERAREEKKRRKEAAALAQQAAGTGPPSDKESDGKGC